ncbi:MAG: OB-fold nucleic acid binding domain-containing protein [Candidatus Njordarchaeia archaeon]
MIRAPLVKIFELNNAESLSKLGRAGYRTPFRDNLLMVRIVGFVVSITDNPEKNFSFLELSDGTGNILIKVFGDSETRERYVGDIELWDVVLVLGLLRHWRDEIYIQPKAMKKLGFYDELYYRYRLVVDYLKLLSKS